jgi:hypothetical protein
MVTLSFNPVDLSDKEYNVSKTKPYRKNMIMTDNENSGLLTIGLAQIAPVWLNRQKNPGKND